MATRFDYPIVYENQTDEIHTSRWRLQGIRTRADSANTDNGWLWAEVAAVSDIVTVSLYKDAACAAGDKVAASSGTVDVSDVDTTPVKCTLVAANDSGISGYCYFEAYTDDPAAAVPILVTLCVDDDLKAEYVNLDDLPDTVCDPTYGMARFCAAATEKILLLVSQLYAEEIGGSGAPEHRQLISASRGYPAYRRIAAPDQLRDAAVHWALMLAFGSCHERHADTMYSQLRDYHDTMRKEAISSWSLAINTDPDVDDDADRQKSVGMARVNRI